MGAITPDLYLSMGLTHEEYRLLTEQMGREPRMTELGMISVMWSEHCGYKYSRPVLAYFAEYKKAIEGEGLENAGVVPIGDGLGVVLKVESHNHPSAVEPYQGAATGVGGIIRDIFTMGARPVALLNSLRFGSITPGQEDGATVARNRHLLEHVVAGIAGYGNCVGVPTVAGEVNFHPRYSGNPLVNAMCVGLVKTDEVASASAKGTGNPVIYLGSATGRDGIHGASFASVEMDEEGEDKRPNVQIGDPFAEKSLIEATLEALQTGAIVGIQDMGAAGLTCSITEMSAKGGVGMVVDLDKVPLRDPSMTGYEIMLSESQERMLAVAHAGRENEVIEVFHKWGLPAVVIGHVTDDGWVRITRHGHTEVDMPADIFADGCPTYYQTPVEPAAFLQRQAWNPDDLMAPDLNQAWLTLMSHPDVASKENIYRQYDHQVQAHTALVPGVGDAAVIAPEGTSKGLATKIDGNARWTMADPFAGGQLATAEVCRNLACVGARPVALTDGLNFGNPQRPEVFWQFERAVRGIADASEAFRVPVVSGNVSFYNETKYADGSTLEILPTPMMGAVGVLERAEQRIGMGVGAGNYRLALVRPTGTEYVQQGLGASLYAWSVCGNEDGVPCRPDLDAEIALQEWLPSLVERGLLAAAHDVTDGGLAVTLAEMAMASDRGLMVVLNSAVTEGLSRADAVAFGEHPGWVVFAYATESEQEVLASCPGALAVYPVGEMTATQDVVLHLDELGTTLTQTVDKLRAAHQRAGIL